MRSRVVAVRCFAEENSGQWEAHCVDLDLTVKGESLDAVKGELDRLVHEAIDEAVLRRRSSRSASRAPGTSLQLRLRYWGLRLAGGLGWRNDALQGPPRRARRFDPRAVSRAMR